MEKMPPKFWQVCLDINEFHKLFVLITQIRNILLVQFNKV